MCSFELASPHRTYLGRQVGAKSGSELLNISDLADTHNQPEPTRSVAVNCNPPAEGTRNNGNAGQLHYCNVCHVQYYHLHFIALHHSKLRHVIITLCLSCPKRLHLILHATVSPKSDKNVFCCIACTSLVAHETRRPCTALLPHNTEEIQKILKTNNLQVSKAFNIQQKTLFFTT